MKHKADCHPSELLCPTTQKWVDAEVAKSIIAKESPQHHCCTLHKAESSSSHTGNETENGTVNGTGDDVLVEQIPMDVGIGQPVTLGMLHPEGQALIRPLLLEYAKHAGPELARLCTVSFR